MPPDGDGMPWHRAGPVQLPVVAVMRLESAWNGFSAGSGRTELRPHRRPAPRWRATAGTPARTGVRLPARPRLGLGHLLGFDIDTEAVSYGGNLIGRPDFLEEEVLQPLRDVARRLQERLGYPIPPSRPRRNRHQGFIVKRHELLRTDGVRGEGDCGVFERGRVSDARGSGQHRLRLPSLGLPAVGSWASVCAGVTGAPLPTEPEVHGRRTMPSSHSTLANSPP